MDQWEYLVTTINIGDFSPDSALTTELNAAGQNGWELVSISRKNDDWTFVSKRWITATPTP